MFRRYSLFARSSAYILTFALFAVGLMFSGCGGEDAEVIEVGAVLSMSGSAGIWGRNVKKGVDLALEEINAAGGVKGKKVVVYYEDSETEPEKAAAALKKLIDKGIFVVISEVASSNMLAMVPIAAKERVVLLSPGASNPDISQAGDHVFRNWHSDALEGQFDADYAYKELGWRRAVTIYVDNAYGVGLARVFKENFESHGGKIVVEESFAQGADNFSEQLAGINDADVDGIYLPGYPDEMAYLLKQARENGITTPVLSSQAFDDPQILAIAKQAAEGVIFSVPVSPSDDDPVVANFRKNYKEKYGVSPGAMSDTGYDAIRIIVWAIEKRGYSPASIKSQLKMLKDFPGAAGVTTFDENGDVVRPFAFNVVKNQEFVSLNPR